MQIYWLESTSNVVPIRIGTYAYPEFVFESIFWNNTSSNVVVEHFQHFVCFQFQHSTHNVASKYLQWIFTQLLHNIYITDYNKRKLEFHEIVPVLFHDRYTIAQFLLLNLHVRQQEGLLHDRFTVNKTYIHTFTLQFYTQIVSTNPLFNIQ